MTIPRGRGRLPPPTSVQHIADRVRRNELTHTATILTKPEKNLIMRAFPEDRRTEDDRDLDMERYSGR